MNPITNADATGRPQVLEQLEDAEKMLECLTNEFGILVTKLSPITSPETADCVTTPGDYSRLVPLAVRLAILARGIADMSAAVRELAWHVEL